MQYATFGAGCVWGAAHLLRSVPGVTASRVGYRGGTTTAPTYEAVCQGDPGHRAVVEIPYAPEQLSSQDLLEVFWQRPAPPSLDDQGPYDQGSQYRAVLVSHDADQATLAVASKAALDVTQVYAVPIVTEIRPATTFWPAEDSHQQYIAKGGAHQWHVLTRTIWLPERSRDRSGTEEVG